MLVIQTPSQTRVCIPSTTHNMPSPSNPGMHSQVAVCPSVEHNALAPHFVHGSVARVLREHEFEWAEPIAQQYR